MPPTSRSTILAGLFLVSALAYSLGRLAETSNALALNVERASANTQLVAFPTPTGHSMVAAPSQAAQHTASLLATIDAPGRDLISITQRIKLHSDAPIPETVNAAPPNYTVGTRHQFYIADLINKNYNTANATIKEITAHAYWYVKDGYGVDLPALKASAQYFEEHIYPTDRQAFGPEPSPGIDNDPHITVLLAPIAGVNGYFSSSDAYPKVVNPFSNQRKMIYIAVRPQSNPRDPNNNFEATMAHEFQHMIHWNVHKDRDVWLDEGFSEVAMFLNGYSPGNFDAQFAAQPDVQLNAWASEPGISRPHYGASYLFLRYLMQHYGDKQFIADVMKPVGAEPAGAHGRAPLLGVGAIDAAVKDAGNPAGFEGAFKDWLVANRLNNPAVENGRYSYEEGGRAQVARTFTSYPATRADSVHQYAADYIKLSGSLKAATVTFRGSTTAHVIAADPHSGQSYWYSNRRDSGDATLTRELDLTRASKAALQFWAWYDIENTFDYAYVEASSDGGYTWDTLKGKYTTTANPNGANFGNAWTGKSGVSAGSNASPPRWVQESVDLGAYAGKRIQIRFEYITDEGYNAPGIAIDDLRVPEIGYSDNAETDNNWNAQGFVRIGSTMPQRWYVALIENGATPRVREMQVNTTGAGTLNLDGFGPSKTVRDATLVISALAPKTTETANYSVTVKKK